MTEQNAERDALRQATISFLDVFETVFHKDWAYTRAQLNISDEGSAELARIMGESAEPHEPGSFLQSLGTDASDLNWGHYELLLRKYRELCKILGRTPV